MKTSYNLILAAVALLSAGGCSDSDDWAPGPQDTDTGVNAYFDMPAQTSYVFEADGDKENMNIDVAISRKDTEKAASIPVTLTSDNTGFSSPASADFQAGEATTHISVNCGDIELGKQMDFTLTLPENETDTYGDGLYAVTYSVIKSEWTEICDNARYIYSYSDYSQMYANTYGKLYHLKGTYMFKLTDFFASGLDMTFECTTPDMTAFTPLINADFDSVSSDYDGLACWYLYNEKGQTWPSWNPEGSGSSMPDIQYALFYGSTDYTTCTMIYDPSTLYGYISYAVDVNFANGDFAWGSWQADFNLSYNPFE